MKLEVPSAVEALRDQVVQHRATLVELEAAHKRAIAGWEQATFEMPFSRTSEIDYEVEHAYQQEQPCPEAKNPGEAPVYEAGWALSMAYGAWCRCKSNLMSLEEKLKEELLTLVTS